LSAHCPLFPAQSQECLILQFVSACQ